uniref:NB-ARC domain-containing protein n=1 Tax=Setaria italica TaxID=4555 RepID=A0A0Q3R775_SETIT
MESVLAKLAQLMGDKCSNLIDLSSDTAFLRDELCTINALLKKLDHEDEDALDPQVKDWSNQVRDVDARAGFFRRIAHFIGTLRACLETAKHIKELKTRLQEINERRKRYRLEHCIASSSSAGIDPRLPALCKEAANLKQLKGVTIVGFGGLGKTTLANEVYHRVKGQFDFHAFVSVSQRPDMARLLNSIRLKLGQQESSYPREVKDLIDNPFLKCSSSESIEELSMLSLYNCNYPNQHRIFDDLWDTISWNTIKCGGLPLAIITVASILASKPTSKKEDWEKIRNSLGSDLGTHPTLAGMRQILRLSYRNLPHHLRTCFLYLGIYPEDHIIRKVDLVRQWVAEGLVSNSGRQDAEDLANSYFDELVNRSMTQPEEIDYNGKVLSCRVHDMMLDLILSKCTEDNFINVLYDSQGMRELQNSKVRRLSLNLNGAEGFTISAVQAVGSQSQIRSLALFGATTCMPACAHLFPESKFLRVLVLELRQLVLLRYLKVEARSSCVKLPTEIQGLRHLETLEMSCGFVGGIPSDVFHLPGLLHLDIASTPGGFPGGINTAHGRSSMNALRSSLGKLGGSNLRCLSVVRYPEIRDDMLSSLAPPPHRLETLDLLAWCLSRVPRWLAELHNLCSLDLC